MGKCANKWKEKTKMCKQCENAIEQHKINVKSVKLYLCFRPFGYYSLQTIELCVLGYYEFKIILLLLLLILIMVKNAKMICNTIQYKHTDTLMYKIYLYIIMAILNRDMCSILLNIHNTLHNTYTICIIFCMYFVYNV